MPACNSLPSQNGQKDLPASSTKALLPLPKASDIWAETCSLLPGHLPHDFPRLVVKGAGFGIPRTHGAGEGPVGTSPLSGVQASTAFKCYVMDGYLPFTCIHAPIQNQSLALSRYASTIFPHTPKESNQTLVCPLIFMCPKL